MKKSKNGLPVGRLAGIFLFSVIAVLLASYVLGIPRDEVSSQISFSDSLSIGELHVEIVSSASTVGVGGTVQLQAVVAPPLADTGGELMWTVLELGRGDFSDPNGETTDFTLTRPALRRDSRTVQVGVVYHTATKAVSTRSVLYLDEVTFSRPYIKNWNINTVDQPAGTLPVPGDVAELTMNHAIPAGYVLVSEEVTTAPAVLTVPAGADADLEVTATFTATYDGDAAGLVTDQATFTFLLPFSRDLDGNNNPDIVDADFLAFDQMYLAGACENPDPNDPARVFRVEADRWLIDDSAMAFSGVGLKSEGLAPEKYNPDLTGAYGQTTCDPTTWECCIEMGPLTRMPDDPDWFTVTKIHEEKHVHIYQLKHDRIISCSRAEWWQDETPDHDGDFVETWAQRVAAEVFDVEFDDKVLEPTPAIPGEILVLDDNPFEVAPTIGTTFNTSYVSDNVLTITIFNENTDLALENITLVPTIVESTIAGDFQPQELNGGFINGGLDGIVDTVAHRNDVQVTAVGRGNPVSKAVGAGADGVLNTKPGGDDTVMPDRKHISSGFNGVVETRASGDDHQYAPVGKSEAGTVAIEAGRDGVLDTVPSGDDEIEPPTESPLVGGVTVVSVPASISAGTTGAATVSIEIKAPPPDVVPVPVDDKIVVLPIPQTQLSKQAEAAIIVFELQGTLGGVDVSEEYTVHFYLPAEDCNGNGVLDSKETAMNMALDADRDSVLDVCECSAEAAPPVDPGFLMRTGQVAATQ